MRISTGFFLVFSFVLFFSFSFVAFSNELKQVQTIDAILEDSISADDFKLSSTSYIYDHNGNVISEIYNGSENRIYLSFAEIPRYSIEAMIATEDKHFLSHKGFDMTGITRAIFINAQSDTIEQGGSTITQQLVKNIYLSNEKTYNRKLTEALYSYQLEKMFSKEKILELYLNAIYFQNGAYGIEAASRIYFSKPAKALTLGETAFLCAIPNNPTFYNPLVSPENTHERKAWILKKMLENEFISESEYDLALEEAITLVPTTKIDRYPDYVTYIYHELEQLIGVKEKLNDKIAASTDPEKKALLINKRRERLDDLLASGVHIHTALIPEKQEKIYRAIQQHIPENQIQASVVMVDHYKHQIVAISGGKDFKKFDFHRGYQAYRQPGSSLKSLLVFAPYLAEKNVPISRTVNAGPYCKNGYCPKNYGGAVYGTVTLETAFKHSYNTSAVRMLDQIGVQTAFSYFNKFGFSKVGKEDFGLSAALGGLTYGVSPLEMTSAYTTFANDGFFQQARGIEKVTDHTGKTILEWDDKSEPVWDPQTNSKMRSLLTKVVAEGTGKRASFQTSYIGGKTGTTNDYHDYWFIGLNEAYTAGVWMGYDTPKSLAPLQSRTPHLLIWRDVMKE